MLALPEKNCTLCPRLHGFICENRKIHPEFYNGPVPSFGSLDAQLLIVGLAPGLTGANQTGRPFTGDYAGIILYNALLKHGFATGHYSPESMSSKRQSWTLGSATEDTLELNNCRITNAVRCVPPENKPETSEIKQCNNFLAKEIVAMPNIKLILSLGLVSHNAVLRALGKKAGFAKFTHGAAYPLNNSIRLVDSYHCSRYNINTGTLTPDMFSDIIAKTKALLVA